MNISNSDLKKNISSPQSLISFMEKSDDFWCIKDVTSTFIYMNERCMDFINFPKGYDIEGKKDKELPVPASELWEDFVAHDQKVMAQNRTISSLDIHYYGQGNTDTPVPMCSTKSPLYDENNAVIGVICRCAKLEPPALLYFMNRFNRKSIVFDAPSDTFSPKELDIAFWLQQKQTPKQIAYRLHMVEGTVRNKIKVIYEKAGVHSLSEFIGYCMTTGLDNYIPSGFIKKGMQILD